MITMENVLRMMAEKGASDLYLSANAPVLLKINGQLTPVTEHTVAPSVPPLTSVALLSLLLLAPDSVAPPVPPVLLPSPLPVVPPLSQARVSEARSATVTSLCMGPDHNRAVRATACGAP